jgi:hypothetical protein
MIFSSWADYLAGHEGAEASSKGITELAENFAHRATPSPSKLKGEEAILFLGISPDGSPLLIHHLTDLGGTRREPLPNLVALAGLQKSTSVVKLTTEDCFANIPSGTDDLAAEHHLPAFSKLVSAASLGAFTRVTPSHWSPSVCSPCPPL